MKKSYTCYLHWSIHLYKELPDPAYSRKNSGVKQKTTPPAAPAPILSKGLRRYVYLTAALTGAAIMIVEILGAKMLAPFVGLSHFVWTAQIAVTLIALACGYYAGGRLADRSRRLAGLYWAILAAAGYLALTVLICEPVAYWCLDFNLPVGSLLASAILFFVPLALLAMTGPFLVRVITNSVEGVGGNVGRLTALSTLGSFAGTLAIGYLMVPFMPNSFTMYATSVTLMLICAGYFGFYHRQPLRPLLAVLAISSSVGLSLNHARLHDYKWVLELFHGNSHFGQLQVLDRRDGSERFYLNDNLIQNTYDPASKRSESAFTYLLAGLARAYRTNINDVLCIGLGVGIVPMDFAHQGARVDVVEINPAVVPVGERFFGLETNKLHLTIDDGRHFLNRCRKSYDVVVLDAFLGDSSPSHLLTREAFTAVKHVLRPGGVLVINTFGDVEPGRDFFTASLNKTLQAVFPGVRIHDDHIGAMFFVATDRPDPVFLQKPDLSGVHPQAFDATEAGVLNIAHTSTESGRVLTDDYNPVEFYDAKNREEIRRRLALGTKEM
jgi:spermidine synthase